MMDRCYSIWRISFLCFLGIGSTCYALAQDAVFSAMASASQIGVQDQLQVDYTIRNVENLRTISKPDFGDFQVVGGPFQRQSSNLSIVNGKMAKSVSITFSYLLQPKKTGTLTVPPAVVRDANGQSYESNNLEIQVVDGSLVRQQQREESYNDPFSAILQQRRQALQQRRERAAEQQRAAEEPLDMKDVYEHIFIRVSVDKHKAYVGEQITTSYKLYTRIPMNVAISKLPSLNGFWTHDLEARRGNIKPEEEIIDGKRYQVFLLKKSALFPQQTGTLILDPAEAEGTARVVRQVRRNNPFGHDPFAQYFGSLMMNDPFFNDDFFSTSAYQDIPVKLKSSPVKIQVLPLPEQDKPADFGAAVGDFTIISTTDRTTLTTDDVLTYTLRISGSGNFKLIEVPALRLPNGLSTFDPHIADTISGKTTAISGSRTITYTVSPSIPGDYEIPPVPFSYYNPKSGTYITQYTDPVKIHVDRGQKLQQDVTTGPGALLADIHPPVSQFPARISSGSKPLFFTATYWSLYALPLLAFIGLIAWRRREEVQAKDMVKLRNRRANSVAHKRLSAAKKLLQQNGVNAFYEEISKAIWLYLSDKLNIPLATLSRETAANALVHKAIPADMMEEIHAVINTCETALYAPGSGKGHMESVYADAVKIISRLETYLKIEKYRRYS